MRADDQTPKITRRLAVSRLASFGLGATALAGLAELAGASPAYAAGCVGTTFNLSVGNCGGPCASGYWCYYNTGWGEFGSCPQITTYACCASSGQRSLNGCNWSGQGRD